MIKLLIYLGKNIKVKKKTIEITNSKKFGKSFITLRISKNYASGYTSLRSIDIKI